MLRKMTMCLLVLALGVLMYPDASAREQEPVPAASTVVRGSIVRAAIKTLSVWIVSSGEWRLKEFLSQPRDPQLSTIELTAEPETPKPEFKYSKLVLEASEKHGVDWRLVASVIAAESSFNPRAVSHKGARGLMQLMPTTAALYKVKIDELFDPGRNIEAGVRHLKWLNERYSGDLKKVVAAYNSGEGAVDRYQGVPPYKSTRAFVRKVISRYENHLRTFPNPAGKLAMSGSMAAAGAL